MREAIGALPAPRWDEKLPAGWTLKEMVGHLGYWESTIPAFVESLRTGTPQEVALLAADDGGGDADGRRPRPASSRARRSSAAGTMRTRRRSRSRAISPRASSRTTPS